MNSDENPELPGMESLPGPVILASVFNSWASTRTKTVRGLSEPTEAVLRAMWTAFSAWCIRTQVDPVALTADELAAYIQSRVGTEESNLTPRYAWRLVTLIDHVIKHLATAQGRASNNAAKELLEKDPGLKFANAKSKEPRPEYLTDSEDQILVSFFKSTVPADSPDSPDSDPDSAILKLRWQDIRNRTSVALQRGGGLTPLEIRTLKLNSVHFERGSDQAPWKIKVPAAESARPHDTPLTDWAQAMLVYWMRVRTELGIPGDLLFPSTRTGKPWGKTAQFNAVAEVLADAGLVGLKGGSYRLRHTFALRQLARPNNTAEMVAEWLGVEPDEMNRYRGLMMAPVEVV